MDRPRLILGLRIAVSAVFGPLCVLLLVLWVRSCRLNEVLAFPVAGTRIHIQSLLGRVTVGRGSKAVSFSQDVTDSLRKVVQTRDGLFGFGFYRASPGDPLNDLFNVRMPHWFPATTFAIITILPWVFPLTRQFSLRTLFLVITLVAGAVGAVVSFAASG